LLFTVFYLSEKFKKDHIIKKALTSSLKYAVRNDRKDMLDFLFNYCIDIYDDFECC